ncbi:hypothetical protein DPX39_100030900 [Trypanosoma brucei equiperdum]|uniref:Uncharacterized protein n=1 Tax=Trypanosoma brucei equiperdum TaxID=630700 RepID=A0A3L6L2V9_9TRYP|nr:hypothetical protein DPX39_100030900 [Trypanosoma brucei equiperdum]
MKSLPAFLTLFLVALSPLTTPSQSGGDDVQHNLFSWSSADSMTDGDVGSARVPEEEEKERTSVSNESRDAQCKGKYGLYSHYVLGHNHCSWEPPYGVAMSPLYLPPDISADADRCSFMWLLREMLFTASKEGIALVPHNVKRGDSTPLQCGRVALHPWIVARGQPKEWGPIRGVSTHKVMVSSDPSDGTDMLWPLLLLVSLGVLAAFLLLILVFMMKTIRGGTPLEERTTSMTAASPDENDKKLHDNGSVTECRSVREGKGNEEDKEGGREGEKEEQIEKNEIGEEVVEAETASEGHTSEITALHSLSGSWHSEGSDQLLTSNDSPLPQPPIELVASPLETPKEGDVKTPHGHL